jgi:hypothetical protein
MSSKGFFYADVQVITETLPQGECSKEKSVVERIEEGQRVSIGEDGKIKLNVSRTNIDSAFNVSIQGIGFDASRYDFTALNGQRPKHIPYQLNFRKRPGNVVDIEFYDASVRMNLDADTIYSFGATEKRADCTIQHTVNVFVERSGVYALRW